MPLYLCRWTNGDCSFVFAASKGEALELLDEIGNAEGCPLTPIPDFMVHFRFSDDGVFEFEEFGEVTEDVLVETAYPIMSDALLNAPRDEQSGALTPEGMEMVKAAVAKERVRVKAKKVAEPGTELGRGIKRTTDAPTRLVDRIVHKVAKEKLGRFQGRGKPN
jgi:hypothetical protein